MSSSTKYVPARSARSATPDDGGDADLPVPVPTSKKAFTTEWRNPEKSLVDYVGAVWARRWLVLILTGVVGIAGFIWALRKPNVYASRATMIVHGAAPTSAVDAAAGLLGQQNILPGQVMNAVSVIYSREVMRAVVDKLGFREILKSYKPVRNPNKKGIADELVDAMHQLQIYFGGSGVNFSKFSDEVLLDHAVDILQQNIDISPAVRGSTIALTYRGVSPQQAQRIVQTVLNKAIEHYNELMAPQEGRAWLDTRVEAALKDEQKANDALEAFREKHKILDFSQDITAYAKSLANLRERIGLEKMRQTENQRVVKNYRERIEGLTEERRLVTAEVMQPDTVRAATQTELLKVMAELDGELARPNGERSSDAKALRTRVESLKRLLADLKPPELIKTTAVQQNPRWLDLDSKIGKIEAESLALEASIPVAEQTLSQGREELQNFRQLHSEALRLKQRLEEAEKKSKTLMEQRDAFEVNQELNARGLTNLRVVEPASFPRQKESPSRGKLILAAVLGGFALAVSWILIRTRMGRAMVRPAHVEFALGRADVVSFPTLQATHVHRFEEARRRGFE